MHIWKLCWGITRVLMDRFSQFWYRWIQNNGSFKIISKKLYVPIKNFKVAMRMRANIACAGVFFRAKWSRLNYMVDVFSYIFLSSTVEKKYGGLILETTCVSKKSRSSYFFMFFSFKIKYTEIHGWRVFVHLLTFKCLKK